MSLANQVFVFAGFTDETLKGQIEAAGGKVTTTITKSVTKMLAKSLAKKNGNGELKKVEEAKKHDVEIVILEEFIKEHDFSLGEKKVRGRPAKSEDDEPKGSPKALALKEPSPKDPSPKAPKAPKAKAAKAPKSPPKKTPMELVSAVVSALAVRNDDVSEALEALEALKALILV